MNDLSDQQLLREYAKGRSNDVFSTLIHRHMTLVHNTARRSLRHLSDCFEDVSQEVYKTLAEQAPQLARRRPLMLRGWLVETTRLIAYETLRSETRRFHRQQEAAAMNELHSQGIDRDWEQLAPELDSALVELPALDREAVILRFYEKRPYNEIAQMLELTEQAAQRRTRRGIEHLQAILAPRGVTLGTGALGALITANAMQAAPAGLAARIAAALAAESVSTVVSTTTKAIAMTTLQKTIAAVTAAGLLGGGILQMHRIQAKSFAREKADLLAVIGQQQQENEELKRRPAAPGDNRPTAEVLRSRAELALALVNRAAAPAPALAGDPNLQAWLKRAQHLQDRAQQTPEAQVPELILATGDDWLDASKELVETDLGFRRALSDLRIVIEKRLVDQMFDALNRFQNATGSRFPTTVEQLAPHFNPPIDPALLARWKVEPVDEVPGIQLGGKFVIMQKMVDPEYDKQWLLGPYGHSSKSMRGRK